MVWSTIANGVIWIMMICAAVGLIGYIRNPNEGIGREFNAAWNYLAIVFIPFAGMLSALPYLSKFILFLFSDLFEKIGADPSLAAGIITGPDMGGWQLTFNTSSSPENWVMGAMMSYLAGPIIAYTMPIAFSMLDKRDHKYFGLGIMAGILSIPFALFISTMIVKLGHVTLRPDLTGAGDRTVVPDYVPDFHMGQILLNMIPCIVFCVILAILIKMFIDIMLKIFMVLGRIVEIGVRIVLVLAVIEYFTGFFSGIFGARWGFDPIMADEVDQFRAIELSGYVVFMMAGAFPMIYLIKKYLTRAASKLGDLLGFSANGIVGLITSWADIVIAFTFYNRIRPKDKVLLTAYSVCGAWILASHLSITVTFQPNMVAAVFIGKVAGGIIAILLAKWIAIPVSNRLEAQDRKLGIIGQNEYLNDEMTAEEIDVMTKS